jgi:hypothetical protein
MRSCLFVMCLLAAPALAAAQSPAPVPDIEAGARVRIWSDSTAAALKARVQTVDPQERTIRVIDGSTPQVLRLSELDRIDVSRGRNRWGWTAGGMLAGATAGVIISRLDGDEGDVAGGLEETAEGLANTFAGALVGGVVGFLVAPERWRTVWRR